MFKINKETKQIDLTRGDIACIRVSVPNEDGSYYEFKVGDVVRFKVFKKKDCQCVEIQKDTTVLEAKTEVDINLTGEDTKIGGIIDKHVDYWYEIELNPETQPQTIIGYEVDPVTNKPLEKIFRLLPEGDTK